MNYNELYNKLLAESKLTPREIIAKCKEHDLDITQGYLSNLKKIDGKIPSDKISTILAKVFNAKYENILVVQAYIDRAPKPILDFFNYAKETTTREALLFLEEEKKEMPEHILKAYLSEKEMDFKKQPLAEFICETIEDMTLPTKEGFKQQIETVKKFSKEDNVYALIPIDNNRMIRYISEEEAKKINSIEGN